MAGCEDRRKEVEARSESRRVSTGQAHEHTGTISHGKVMLVFRNVGKRPREQICEKNLK